MKKSTINKIIKAIIAIVVIIAVVIVTSGCALDESASGTYEDSKITSKNASTLQHNQPTPTDIEYSLERYNLIRRAYWINGQREKANAYPCEIEKPLGYIILFTGSTTVGSFAVDGKVSSLNSYLTPDSEHYEYISANYTTINDWLADVDGTYGENDNGIFFFTPDGNYIEWSGEYLYSDIPFEVSAPVVNIGGSNE